jgi:hypothetical protein
MNISEVTNEDFQKSLEARSLTKTVHQINEESRMIKKTAQ